MDDVKRITPAEVVEAYRRTGMRIATGEYISGDLSCGCGMGVYAVAILGADRHSYDRFGDVDRALDEAGFTKPYQNGFASGFDGDPPRMYDYSYSPDYRLGHEDGKAAYAAAKEAENG